jgi:DNA-binding response OmpR family regulator
VVEAADADSALQALTACPVDVLIADVGLPRMSGVALAREARAKWPTVKIIFATGDPTITAEASDLGAVLLGKPYAPEDLYKVMARILASEIPGPMLQS